MMQLQLLLFFENLSSHHWGLSKNGGMFDEFLMSRPCKNGGNEFLTRFWWILEYPRTSHVPIGF